MKAMAIVLITSTLFHFGCAKSKEDKTSVCDQNQLKASNNFMDSLEVSKVDLSRKDEAQKLKVMGENKLNQWLQRCEQLKADQPKNQICYATNEATKKRYSIDFKKFYAYCDELKVNEAKIREKILNENKNKTETPDGAEASTPALKEPTFFIIEAGE